MALHGNPTKLKHVKSHCHCHCNIIIMMFYWIVMYWSLSILIWLWPSHWSLPPKFGHKNRIKISIFFSISVHLVNVWVWMGQLVVPGEWWWPHIYIIPGLCMLWGVLYCFYCYYSIHAKRDMRNQSNLPLLEVWSVSEYLLINKLFCCLYFK